MPNKFFAKKVIVDGIKFDSSSEARYYQQLKLREKAGEISDIQLQPEFEIIPPLYKMVEVKLKTKTKLVRRTDEQAAKYHADFSYKENGKMIIVEVKGGRYLSMQKDYVLRRKLIKRKLSEMNDELGYDYYEFKEVLK